jgi:predicted nucleic acid-binding protein
MEAAKGQEEIMAFAAFYDANVLIPHEIRDILMISAHTRLHSVYWSEDVFAEWLRNAGAKKLAPVETVLRFQANLNEMYPDALITRVRYSALIESMTNDEKDRHVLAAAVIAEAEVLVTRNIDDFPRESVEKYNIEVQTPDQFVRHQAEFSPPRYMESFLARAERRNQLSIARGEGPLSPYEIAEFLRDGPSNMPATGQYIIDLLGFYRK